LNETVPYDPKFYRCEAILIIGPWAEISPFNRGIGTVNGKPSSMIWDVGLSPEVNCLAKN